MNEARLSVILRGEHLVRGFGEGALRSLALRDVSIDLLAGQTTVLMGPSGSGKSTLLAILAGLLRPDSGEVEALGQSVVHMTDTDREVFRRRHCGFVFQGYNLFPALTAQQQVEIVLRWGEGVGAREAAQRAKDTLGLLGLGKKMHLRPWQLSGGEKQRVAVARALVKKPTLVFADEPTAALDWEHGEQVVELLRESATKENATVLIVSHDPRVTPLADRVLFLADGKISGDHSIVDGMMENLPSGAKEAHG
ncbi:ABC transporter ATP-binding protein [bacterium]|nr:ABC transporter ATP-binding protein [bacterium]